jgi:hypothetical protein
MPSVPKAATRPRDPATDHVCGNRREAECGVLALLLTLAATPVTAMLVFSSSTFAAPPEQDYEAAGATFVHAGPDSGCTSPGTPVRNSDNTKGGSETSGPGKSEPNSEEVVCLGQSRSSPRRLKPPSLALNAIYARAPFLRALADSSVEGPQRRADAFS